MPKTKEQAEQSKRHIAKKAKELFDQKGYFLTSMEEIRINSGMSKGSIYYHFKSKEALFIYILELYMEEWLMKWNEISSKLTNATEKLYSLAEYFASDYENPLMKAADEFSRSQSADSEIMTKIIEIARMHYPIFLEIIRKGMEDGEFVQDNVDELACVLFGLLAGIGPICQYMDRKEMVAMHHKAIDVFLKGISSKR